MRRTLGMLSAAALLAGCASQSLPLRESVAAPTSPFEARGETSVVVRTFVLDARGARREVGGALCDVSSVLFAAQVTTPARLTTPSFGPQSATLNVDCRAGALSGQAQQGIVTRWIRAPGAFGWPGPFGPYGPGARGPWGWDGGYWGAGGSYPVFVYPSVAVELR